MVFGVRARRWVLLALEVAFVAVVAYLAFRWRMLGFDALTVGDHVYFIGTDPYYHWRVTLATTEHFPETVRFDPFTYYPFGTGTGQFGSLFDQGAAALAIALGRTDRLGVAETIATFPAVLGGLVFVPFYFLARLLVGRIGAVVASVALLLLPSEFFIRSLAGYADHHVAEAIGLVVSLLGVLAAIEASARRWDAIVAWRGPGGWMALTWPVVSVVLGALGLVLYFLVWPPAVLVAGIFGAFFFLLLSVEHARGVDVSYLVVGGAGPFLLAGVLLVPRVEVSQLNFNTFSWMQPVACLGVGLFVLAFVAASRAFRDRVVPPLAFPVASVVALAGLQVLVPGFLTSAVGVWAFRLASVAAAAGAIAFARASASRRLALPAVALALVVGVFLGVRAFEPGLYGSIQWGASWITGIGVKRETLTIAEARPSTWDDFFDSHVGVFPLFMLSVSVLLPCMIAKGRARFVIAPLGWTWLAAQSLLWYQEYAQETDPDYRFGSAALVINSVLLGGAAFGVLELLRVHERLGRIPAFRAPLLLFVTSVLMYSAAWTQVRFTYYFGLVAALGVGLVAFVLAEVTGLNRALESAVVAGPVPAVAPAPAGRKAAGRRARSREAAPPRFGWHQSALAVVVLVLLPSLVVPQGFGTGDGGADGNADGEPDGRRNGVPDDARDCSVQRLDRDRVIDVRPAWSMAKCFGGPDPNLFLWVQSLDWLRVHTPDVGLDIRDIRPLAERPPGGVAFRYPPQAYGVLSWWDYGHWIEVEGERPPVANPFQQAAPFASCWLTATSEVRANDFLALWSAASFARPNDLACTEIATPVPLGEPAHPVRYVMIDDEMAAGKFHAITVWAKYDHRYSAERELKMPDGSRQRFHTLGQGYYDTMLSRLWADDAATLGTYRLVHETRAASLVASMGVVEQNRRGTTSINDIIRRDEWSPEEFERYNSLPRDEAARNGDSGTDFIFDMRLASAVKTFERVKGALLEGSGAAAQARVDVQIELVSDTTGRHFNYSASAQADSEGRFSIRVPYATSEYVPAAGGGTDYAVRAAGSAFVTSIAGGRLVTARVDVPDSAVLFGGSVSVRLV